MEATVYAVIRQLSVEITSASGDGLALQQAVSDWAGEGLTRALTELVEQLPKELDLVLDVLMLDLGAVAESEWQRAVTEQVQRQLRDQLAGAMMQHGGVEQEATRRPAGVPAPLVRSTGGSVLAFYIRHGYLPWFGDRARLQAELSQLTRHDDPDLAALGALRAELGNWHAVVLRLVRLLPESVLRVWLSSCGDVTNGWWSAAAADLRSLEAQLRGSLQSAAIARAPGRELPDALFVQLLIAAGGVEGSWRDLASPALPTATAPGWLQLAVGLWLEQALRGAAMPSQARDDSRSAARALQTREFCAALEHSAELAAASGHTPAPSEEPSKRQKRPSPRRDPVGEFEREARREGVFVEHAGLILLSPYLRTYLQRLGLTEEGRLLDSAAALAALHYLASGTVTIPAEHEVVLAKLLCGLPPEQAPPLLLSPMRRTCEEGDDLLRSVITHWTTLRNTSLPGLREAFLQRPGKLSLDDRDRWYLQVEQRPYDMLLSTLPWGFQMTRLPWMERLLVAEWLG